MMLRTATRADIDGAIMLATIAASNKYDDMGCNVQPHCDSCYCPLHCKHEYEWECAADALGIRRNAVDLWWDATMEIETLAENRDEQFAVVGQHDNIWGLDRTEEAAIADAKKNGENTSWDTLGFAVVKVPGVQVRMIQDLEVYDCSKVGITVVRDRDHRLVSAAVEPSVFWINRTGEDVVDVGRNLEAAALLRDGWLPLGWEPAP